MSKKLTRRDFLRLSGLTSVSLASGVRPSLAYAASNPPILVSIELLGGNDNYNFSGYADTAIGRDRYDAMLASRYHAQIAETLILRNADTIIEPNQVVQISSGDDVGLHPLFGGPLKASGVLNNLRLLRNFRNVSGSINGSHRIMQRRMAFGTTPGLDMRAGTFARLYDSGQVKVFGAGGVGENYTCETCARPPMQVGDLENFNLAGAAFAGERTYQGRALKNDGGQDNADHVANVLTELSAIRPEREISPLEAKYTKAFKGMFEYISEAEAILQNAARTFYNAYEISSTPNGFPVLGFNFVPNYNAIARKFRGVASTIKYQLASGNTTPLVFNIGITKYDAHGDWQALNNTLMYQLGNILNVFSLDLKDMGVWNDTVILCNTEFGRRMYANGSGETAGTDHGGGMSTVVLGGRIKKGIAGGDILSRAEILRALELNGQSKRKTHNWPAHYDIRGVVSQLIENHLGLDPRLAYPGSLYADIGDTDTNFNLFI